MAASLTVHHTQQKGKAKGQGLGLCVDGGAKNISSGRAGRANHSSLRSKCASEGWSSLPRVNACIYHCRDDLLSSQVLLEREAVPSLLFNYHHLQRAGLPEPYGKGHASGLIEQQLPCFICYVCVPLMSLKMPSPKPCPFASSSWRRTKHLGPALVQEKGISYPSSESSLPWASGSMFNACCFLVVCLNRLVLDPNIPLMVFLWL